MVFCRETKKVVTKFNDVFEHSKDCCSDNRNPFKDKGYLKFNITSACDMALWWKGLETGGGLGCTGVKYPCECCPLGPTNFTVPNAPSKKLTCPLCRPFLHPFLDDGSIVNKNYEPNLQCHHHDMHDDDNRLEREAELQEKMITVKKFESLHFLPGEEAQDRFDKMIKRQMDMIGGLSAFVQKTHKEKIEKEEKDEVEKKKKEQKEEERTRQWMANMQKDKNQTIQWMANM